MSLSKKDLKRFAEFDQAYTRGAQHPAIGLIRPEQFHTDGDALVFRRTGLMGGQPPLGCFTFVLAFMTIVVAIVIFRANGFNPLSLTGAAGVGAVATIALGIVLLQNKRLREELRIGPDGIERIAVGTFHTSRNHITLKQVTSVAVDRGGDGIWPHVMIYHAGSDRPVRVRIFLDLAKCNWMADVIRLRLEELSKFTNKPDAQELKTHRAIAKAVPSPTSSRSLFIPGGVTPIKPMETMVQLEEYLRGITLKHDPTSTHLRMIIHWLVFSLVVAFLSGLPLLYFITMDQPISPEFWWIFGVFGVGVPAVVGCLTLRVILRGYGGQVLQITDEQIWHERTCLKGKPPRIATGKIKMLGVDDPETGIECENDFEGIYDHRVILVFLDHRRVKLTQFPAYSKEEADYLADRILKRFPQMFDPSVLPDSMK